MFIGLCVIEEGNSKFKHFFQIKFNNTEVTDDDITDDEVTIYFHGIIQYTLRRNEMDIFKQTRHNCGQR